MLQVKENMSPIRIYISAVLILVTAYVSRASADDDDGAEERQQLQIMRDAVERGQAKSLTEILEIARKSHPGEVVGVEFEMKGTTWIYEVKIAEKTGRIVEMHVNAADGQILKVEEK